MGCPSWKLKGVSAMMRLSQMYLRRYLSGEIMSGQSLR